MRLAKAAIVALLFTSCSSLVTTKIQLRGTQPPVPPVDLVKLEQRADIDDGAGGSACSDLVLRKRSIEEFVDDTTVGTKPRTFKLGVIELSDDGHVTDDIQESTVLKMVSDAAKEKNGALIVTFAHGWHHRAKVCDNNMACFRRVLYALSRAERARYPDAPRQVVGIYIGWRGDSWKNPSALSFYERKATAQNVGHNGGREVLLLLNRIYEEQFCEPHTHRVTMVTVGHSFGGALVYSAMEGVLVRELRKQHVVGAEAKGETRPLRPGIGDLVVLVNPAFEARRYEWFDADLRTAGRYDAKQLPVMLTVASKADQAVGVAFPLGRTVYFLFQPWRYRGAADVIGAGHYGPQTTHDLLLTDRNGNVIVNAKKPDKPETKVADEKTRKHCELGDRDLATCECEYNVPAALKIGAANAAGSHADLIATGNGAVPLGPDEQVMLKPRDDAHWDPHTPFLVASASGDVISAHSDIYTPRFITFLAGYINAFLVQSEAQTTAAGTDERCHEDPNRFNVAPK